MHRGQFLKEMVKESGRSVTWLTKKMRISRTTYYNHTRDEDLPAHLLTGYSHALGVDFSQHIPELKKLMFSVKDTSPPKETQDAISYWKQKHDALLEKWDTLQKNDR
ncbi:hypothetical protein SAMN04487894_1212 [Niabella drilacis]|uniref:HTH cro/C1-type domain-containing protein n=1 Tax=Niabella drilacis (strain DSM 25811 / CCM 8410 / CCUG 62505 / LMG 26954 / E90) TaxID=1285928 RepID=A0A1G7A424_NIADE|nr:hypothetical protein SAMN04487894_1212 [Niabella drilacis]